MCWAMPELVSWAPAHRIVKRTSAADPSTCLSSAHQAGKQKDEGEGNKRG